MHTVSEILNIKSPMFNICEPGTLVRNALSIMSSMNLSYVVVIQEDLYRGLFTERDYARNVVMQGRTSAITSVAEVMTTDLPMVTPDTTVDECMLLMNQHKTRYLIVFDDEAFTGVITMHDIIRAEVVNASQRIEDDLSAKEKTPIY